MVILVDELRQWARDSEVPPRDVARILKTMEEDDMISDSRTTMVDLRARLMFQSLERLRVKGVPGTFNSAQFNQWWALLWVLGEEAINIQAQEAVRGYPDGPAREARK